MAFLQGGDDAFEAALSFLDEFAPDTAAAGSSTSSCPRLDEQLQDLNDSSDSKPKRSRRRAIAKKSETEEEKRRRKAELNEKRKLLRKTGVYGDANRARNERSREVAYLREQMEKLQVELHILKCRQDEEKKEEKQRNATGLVARKASEQVSGMWQGLAEQQRRRREEVERDNMLLRLALERQKKVADGLRSFMQRRATQLTNECSSLMTLACARQHVVDVLRLSGDMDEFRGLFQRLDDAYRKVADVFIVNGLTGLTISPVDVHVREDVDGYFALSSYKMLPFDVPASTEAAWNHFKGVEKHLGNGSLYEKAEKNLDGPYTIVADFKKEIRSNSARADIQVKQVIRRYVEEDRDVIVWVSRAVPIEIKHKLLRGLTYHLRGYAVTKRSPDSTPDREMSVLQLCYMIALDQEAETTYKSDDVCAMKNFMIISAAENMKAHRVFIENALVDQALPVAPDSS